jgi:hypothetical protein
MEDKNTSLESLMADGLIGAGLGALLSNDKEEGALIGALLGAAIAATANASEEARKTAVPLLVEENGELYEIFGPGKKRFVRRLPKPVRPLGKSFKLK